MTRHRPGRPRAARRRRAGTAGPTQLAWRRLRNPLPPLEPLSADQVEHVHLTSLRVLEEIGMDILDAGARGVLKAAGAAVTGDGPRVRLDRGLVLEAVARAPSSFTLHARNPARNLILGGDYVNFATVASAPYVSDLDGGRRGGNFHDFRNLLRLAQSLNIIHLVGGYPVEPIDLPPATRHLDALRAIVGLTDKATHAYALGATRMRDAIEIARIARGIDRETLAREPSLYTVVNTSSPLRLDKPMAEGLIEMARANQIVCVTPFTLSGAMAPATVAGALTQQNAEALATLALVQIVNPGTPVIYGGFTSNVDMKSGAPAFGTPEYARAALAGGQLARRYRLPYRSSNVNAANAVDAQAAYESQISLFGAVMGHANMVMHAAGWLEGGLTASFEKMVIDAELLQMMAALLEPFEIDEAALGLEAMREVGPGGHFFGAADTLGRYETAFYGPLVSDWRNYESWAEAGRPDALTRANAVMKRLIADHVSPPLDPAIADELDAFVAKRTEEGGALEA